MVQPEPENPKRAYGRPDENCVPAALKTVRWKTFSTGVFCGLLIGMAGLYLLGFRPQAQLYRRKGAMQNQWDVPGRAER